MSEQSGDFKDAVHAARMLMGMTNAANPRHLFGGTHRDNMADAAAKGRYARQIQEPVKTSVRALAELGMSKRAIARQVGIDRRSVGRILAQA